MHLLSTASRPCPVRARLVTPVTPRRFFSPISRSRRSLCTMRSLAVLTLFALFAVISRAQDAVAVAPPAAVTADSPAIERLLHAAAAASPEELTALVASGVNANSQDPETGDTAMHRAVRNSEIDIVVRLLQAGASPDVVNNEGKTPLHVAAENNVIAAVKLLVRQNADRTIVDKNGATALALAEQAGHAGAVRVLSSKPGPPAGTDGATESTPGKDKKKRDKKDKKDKKAKKDNSDDDESKVKNSADEKAARRARKQQEKAEHRAARAAAREKRKQERNEL